MVCPNGALLQRLTEHPEAEHLVLAARRGAVLTRLADSPPRTVRRTPLPPEARSAGAARQLVAEACLDWGYGIQLRGRHPHRQRDGHQRPAARRDDARAVGGPVRAPPPPGRRRRRHPPAAGPADGHLAHHRPGHAAGRRLLAVLGRAAHGRRRQGGVVRPRGALRARPARRAGAHGRQEARPDPRRRRLARPWPQTTAGHVARRRSATTTSTSLVDDHSRLAYSEILPDEKGTTCAAFLTRAAAYFAAHGITRIERVHDRQRLGLPPLHRVAVAVAELGASSTSSGRTAPGRTARSNASTAPCRPNGPTARSSPATPHATAALAPWLEHYNTRTTLARRSRTGRTDWTGSGPRSVGVEYSAPAARRGARRREARHDAHTDHDRGRYDGPHRGRRHGGRCRARRGDGVPGAAGASARTGFTPGAAGLGDPYFPLAGNGGYDAGHYDLRLAYDPGAGSCPAVR